jgi:hypothetical protein
VIHRFGALTDPDGDRHLLEVLAAARESLTVVSCFGAEDLDADRLRAPGALLLADLLALAARRTPSDAETARRPPTAGPNPDRLVLDLAERLWRAGLVVGVDHAVCDGDRIPLVVGHPDLPDRMLVAVLTDDDAYVGEASVRVRDRQRPQRLERLGWTVVQVWSAAAFLDPQGEADAIFDAVLDARSRVAVPVGLADESRGHGAGGGVGAGAGAPSGGARAPEAAEQGWLLDAEDAVVERGPRPDVEVGLPIGAYTDDQLDELTEWIRRDQVSRDDDQMAAALRAELGVTRRGTRVDTVVGAAVRRARG